ncbi:MAG: indolepyruvate oxidoreductase subunit beta [Bacteroidales bacterium]|nr:indolepyruvate oxidoreductase subunit beta [Bacteroidales bacterium]MBQ5944519.1 indolepyruvate oxidoreductase subunit beta [Bacteroidales bacterium]
MKKDIILCGVGGQGILSIATVIGEAATAAGLHLKQAEVHGMSQRGGDVESDLRLSTEPVSSDLIAEGTADIILSMEPMEALRYLRFLSPDGAVITASEPLVNIPDYPDMETLLAEVRSLPDVTMCDIAALARESGNPRGANMVLLGMAADRIGIVSPGELREAVARIFAPKGEDVVLANQAAFDLGMRAAGK